MERVIWAATFYVNRTGKSFDTMPFSQQNAEKPGGAKIVSLTRLVFMQTATWELAIISFIVYNIQ